MIPSCSALNSLLTADLQSLALKGELTKAILTRTGNGCYVVVYRQNSEVPLYLTTRRERNLAKIFKDQNRISNFLTGLKNGDHPLQVELEQRE